MLFLYVDRYLSITSGLILFGLGVFGLSGEPGLNPHALTELLSESGYGANFDRFYLILLLVLGFWLTIGLYVRVPAALALGLVLGKILIVGQSTQLEKFSLLALALIVFAVLLRLVTRPWRERRGSDGDGDF